MTSRFLPFDLTLRGERRHFDRPLVMGILNITPDSFYAGCRVSEEEAIVTRVHEIVGQGGDIIDLGAYSTRPGAAEVDPAEELSRLRKAMAVVRREAPEVITSVDTFRARVAQEAVEELGVDIINDVSGGNLDPDMFATVAALKVPYILMHMRGTPATMQQLTQYDNVIMEVVNALEERMKALHGLGVEDVIVDPGFGFSKTLEQNYEMLAGLGQFHRLGAPLLVGVSRKSMIYRLLDVTPHEALNGTTVVNTMALMAGAGILRVHDVAPAVEARAIVEATWKAAGK